MPPAGPGLLREAPSGEQQLLRVAGRDQGWELCELKTRAGRGLQGKAANPAVKSRYHLVHFGFCEFRSLALPAAVCASPSIIFVLLVNSSFLSPKFSDLLHYSCTREIHRP